MDIEHSLLWHDPGRFNGYVLSQHFAGTPVDPVNLRDALRAVKERAAIPALGALRWHDSEVDVGDAADHVADRAVQRGGAIYCKCFGSDLSLIAYEPVQAELGMDHDVPVRQGERRRVR